MAAVKVADRAAAQEHLAGLHTEEACERDPKKQFATLGLWSETLVENVDMFGGGVIQVKDYACGRCKAKVRLEIG